MKRLIVCLILLVPLTVAAQTSESRVFTSDAGILFNVIKPNKVADFERIVAKFKEAMVNSENPVRREQAKGIRVFKLTESIAGGNWLYLILVDPPVKGADYTVSRVLAEAFPKDVMALFAAYSGAFAGGVTLQNYALVSDFSKPMTATPTSGAVASNTVSNDGTRAKCAKDWPDDFQMRVFCEKQQQDAAGKLGGRSMNTVDLRLIRDKCAKDWPDDFQMRNFCEEQQMKALGILKR